MRIAYVSQMADVSAENGIAKKIRSQIVSWVHEGHEVCYFALAPTTAVWSGFSPVATNVLQRGNSFSRFFQASRLAAAVRGWRPDAIYYRYGHHVAGLPALFREIPTIAEINSDDLREYPLSFPLRKRIYHRLTRPTLLRSVAAFVPVTSELGTRLQSFKKPSLAVGNSIRLDDYTPLAPAPDAQTRHLIFLGTPSSAWHGMDRIQELARHLPQWMFDIVGYAKGETSGNPDSAPFRNNEIYHGYITRARYEPLLLSCTAALGSFGIWRNGMMEACPLKVREYLAYGLPVIAAYKDTDIPEDAEYFLRLPNDSSSPASHLPRILSFLSRWHNRRVPRAAIAHLDTSAKERTRLQFMAEVVREFRCKK